MSRLIRLFVTILIAGSGIPLLTNATTQNIPCNTIEPYTWLSAFVDPSANTTLISVRIQCVTEELSLNIDEQLVELSTDEWAPGDLIILSTNNLVFPNEHLHTIEFEWPEEGLHSLYIEHDYGETALELPIPEEALAISFQQEEPTFVDTSLERWMNTYITNHEIYIQTLFPNPEGSDIEQEMITLINNSEEEYSLEGFILSDTARSYTFDESFIESESSLELSRELTRITLNNQEETLHLISPDGLLLDSATYENSIEDHIYTLA